MLHLTTLPASAPVSSRVSRRVHGLGFILALTVAVLGVSVVVGWLAGYRHAGSLDLPGVTPLRPSVGAALAVLGVALALAHRRAAPRLVVALAAVTATYAVVELADRVLDLELGLDRALAPGGLGLPDGAPSGVALILLVLAAVVIVTRFPALGSLGFWAALVSLVLSSTFMLIAVEVGAADAGRPPFSQLVGVLLTALAASGALLRPDAPPLPTVLGPLRSARVIRRAMVVTFLVPPVATVVINVLGTWGFWHSEWADAFITAAVLVVMLALVFYGGTQLIHAEERSLWTLDRLLESAERVRELYDEAPTGYVSLNADGELTEVNATLSEWLGRPSASLIGRRLVDLTTDATRPVVHAAVDELRRGRVIEDLNFDLARDAAEPLAVGMRAEPRLDGDGALQLVRATLFDTTQQREAERARRAADARYREIVETANEGIWTLDLAGRTTFVNPRVGKLLGHPPEELVGRRLEEFLDEDGVAQVRVNGAVFEEGLPTSSEFRLRRSDDTWVLVQVAATVLRDERGRPVGSLGLVTDITARRAAERALEDQRRRLQQLVDENPSGLAIKDLDLRYVFVNREFSAMAGIPQEELVGMRAVDVAEFGQAAETEALQRRALELREAIHEERRTTGHGELQVRLNTYFPLIGADGEPYAVCVTTTDVSELKQMEERLAVLNRDLEARVASRTRELEMANRDLSTFASTVAHDLRAPLRTITGFSTIVLEEYADDVPEQARHYLDLVSRGAADMSQLIGDLLTFARTGQDEVERREVDPGPLVREVLADLSGDEPIEGVDLVIAPDLPVCLADPRLLRIVLQNLLANALKFTRGRADRRVEVGWTPGEDGEVTYWVTDNGVGFDQTQADRLFSMFQRLHPADEFEGTGLGLAIVERAIHRHGGAVSAVGDQGAGATISFSLGPGGRPAPPAARAVRGLTGTRRRCGDPPRAGYPRAVTRRLGAHARAGDGHLRRQLRHGRQAADRAAEDRGQQQVPADLDRTSRGGRDPHEAAGRVDAAPDDARPHGRRPRRARGEVHAGRRHRAARQHVLRDRHAHRRRQGDRDRLAAERRARARRPRRRADLRRRGGHRRVGDRVRARRRGHRGGRRPLQGVPRRGLAGGLRRGQLGTAPWQDRLGTATARPGRTGRRRLRLMSRRSVRMRQRQDPRHQRIEAHSRRLGGLRQQARLGEPGDRVRLDHPRRAVLVEQQVHARAGAQPEQLADLHRDVARGACRRRRPARAGQWNVVRPIVYRASKS